MQLFGLHHLARKLLERDVATFDKRQQLAIQREGARFGFERLAQHGANVELMRVEKRTDFERWIGAERGNPLANLLRMHERFVRLRTQPRDDRNAPITEHEERVMRVA